MLIPSQMSFLVYPCKFEHLFGSQFLSIFTARRITLKMSCVQPVALGDTGLPTCTVY